MTKNTTWTLATLILSLLVSSTALAEVQVKALVSQRGNHTLFAVRGKVINVTKDYVLLEGNVKVSGMPRGATQLAKDSIQHRQVAEFYCHKTAKKNGFKDCIGWSPVDPLTPRVLNKYEYPKQAASPLTPQEARNLPSESVIMQTPQESRECPGNAYSRYPLPPNRAFTGCLMGGRLHERSIR